ncbi:MAG: hypothetical protein K2J08_09900 [Ruminococcus sp.]|nr:hypothetical protein [Ruminococcus sp.]
MFSIVENIYDGWQYFVSILSLVGGNFHLVIENIGRMSSYMTDFFTSFSAPSWFTYTVFSILGLSVVSKICHWG